jgi:hypothetical protein
LNQTLNDILRELAMWTPFIIWWSFYLFFKYWCPNREMKKNFSDVLDVKNVPRYYPPAIWKYHVPLVFFLSLLWRVIFAFDYTYEAHIYIETVIPILFAYPFMCLFFSSLRRLEMFILPLNFFVII